MLAVTFDYSEILDHANDMRLLATEWYPLAMESGVLEAALFFEREAKQNAPLDTGRLRASIGHGPEGVWESGGAAGLGYWIDVGTNVEYAPYMEFGFTMGTAHVAYIKKAGGFRWVYPFSFTGYHYMQRAANSTERIIQKLIQKHLDIAAQRAGF